MLADEPKASAALPPVLAYARLLEAMHRLIVAGKGDGPEAESLADRMDGVWSALTTQEQLRMRHLASHLNSLRDGRPKQLAMSREQLADWRRSLQELYGRREAGSLEAMLSFLNRPVPAGLPAFFVPYLQARWWEKAGDVETALLFMREADRLEPDPLSVMLLLQQLERFDEAAEHAHRIIGNHQSPALELYLAGVALLAAARSKSDAEAAPLLQEAIPALRRGLTQLSEKEKTECPEAASEISKALGLALERLGKTDEAIAFYNDAIGRNPHDAGLLAARGVALYWQDASKAIPDLAEATRLGVPVIWPYVLLARQAIQSGAPASAIQYARMAENQPGPPVARAEVYEIIGMAQTELGNPPADILGSFDRALALDPKNDRIRENREIASKFTGGRAKRPQLRQLAPIMVNELLAMRSDEIRNRVAVVHPRQRENQLGLAVGAV